MRRRVRWVRWLLGLACIGMIAFVAIPKGIRQLESMRVREQMSKFEAAISEGHISEASNFLQVANVLRPESPDVQGGIRILNAAQGSPAALMDIQRLMALNAASSQEMLVVAEQALNRNLPGVAIQALGRLGESPSTQRTILEVRLKAVEGDSAGAMELARSAAASIQDSDSANKILLEGASAGLDENFSASAAILYRLSLKQDQTGLQALRHLARYAFKHQNNKALPFRSLADSIRAHPLHGAYDLLAAADLELVREPTLKKGLVDSLVREFETAPKESADALADWLIFHEEYQAAIDFIGEKRATEEDVSCFQYAFALASLEKWEDMNIFLRGRNLPLTAPSLRLLFMAHETAKKGELERSQNLWSELDIRCVNEPLPFASLMVQTALKLGYSQQARTLAWTLARHKDSSIEGFRLLLGQLPPSTESSEMIPIYREMIEFLPESPMAQRGLAYNQLLAGENIPAAAKAALDLHKASNNKNATRHIAALALLRLGEIAKADALYDTVPPLKNAPAANKAIRVAILHKMNKTEEARSLVATIPETELNPETKMLLSE